MSHRRQPLTIPSSYSRIVARELHLQERDLGRLLQGTGLPVEVLLPDDETRLTGPQQLRVLENARRMSTAPEIGLRIGVRLRPASHGPIGYLVQSSPDLLTALEALRDFLPLRIPFARLSLDFKGRWLRCGVQITLAAQAQERRLLLECFALLVQSLVESFLDGPLREGRIHFDYPRPDYHRVYADYLHVPVRFNRADNRVLLPSHLAGVVNPSGDFASYALARDLCEKLLDQATPPSLTMTDRVRRLLLSQPAGSVTEEDVARALFVSSRTLARRLGSEGTSYRRVRESLLAEMAMRHLRDTDLKVEAVAALLGYHDAANFRRAFRRWSGCTPSAFRGRLPPGEAGRGTVAASGESV